MNEELLRDMVTTDDKKMVLVEHVLPGYRNTKDWVAIDRALLGEAHGKWRIVRRKKTYEDKMMVAQEPQGPDALAKKDVFGPQAYETKGVKKKRIAWVQDSVIRGGAEISNELVVRVGLECGFNIKTATHQMKSAILEQLLSQCDLVILNNIWAFPGPQMAIIEKAIFKQRKPYVKYEHDHRELGRPEFSKKLFKGSKLNVFLSPVHHKNHMGALEAEGVCLPLAIDTGLFRPVEGVERKAGTALICNIRHLRTWNNLQAYIDGHPETSFIVMSNGDSKVRGGNVIVRPMIPYEEMPSLYSEFEYLVHIMDGWGAGERVVFEAALCGCKIVMNERVGHSSWGRDLADIDGLRVWLRKAPFDFWREIDRRMS